MHHPVIILGVRHRICRKTAPNAHIFVSACVQVGGSSEDERGNPAHVECAVQMSCDYQVCIANLTITGWVK